VIAIAIKLYDRGPILYRQERLTRDEKPFWIYKFRSMKVDSEKAGARLAAKGDDRVTPVGRIIRNIHFDELPQLFNILKGDMSMVGPRPERKVIADQYTERIPEFPFRCKVKAGLTGYAQVYGKYNTTPYDKLKLDLTYIENYSFWLDIKIMLLTFKILFQKENTEGIDVDQVTADYHE
jgi:lipopolysaccharide/colanic/teichoic acid biosynthesis glycosyltransferase